MTNMTIIIAGHPLLDVVGTELVRLSEVFANAIDFPNTEVNENWIYFLPEISVIAVGLFLAFSSDSNQRSQAVLISLLFLAIACVICVILAVDAFFKETSHCVVILGSFTGSYFSFVVKTLILAAVIFVYQIYASLIFKKFQSSFLADQFFLVLWVMLFGFLMLSSTSLIALGLTLTGLNVSCYILLAGPKTAATVEASIKYFVVGMLGISLYFLGVWFIWVDSGTVDFTALVETRGGLGLNSWIGVFCIFSSFLIKLSSFPVSMWAVDVYDGASNISTYILIAVAKTVSLICLATLLLDVFPTVHTSFLSEIALVAGAASMVIGTFGAIRQQRIRRFLAYSSINHVGFMLVLLALVSTNTAWVLYYYLVAYVVASLLFFSVLVGVRYKNGREIQYLTELADVAGSHKWTSRWLSIAILSFAGIPPFVGFFAKYLAIFFAFDLGALVNLFILFFLMGFAAYNYLRMLKNIYFRMETAEVTKFYTNWSSFSSFFMWMAVVYLSPVPLFFLLA